ncbi:hypothetical protein ERC79_18435 [Rhodococcus sp. ABRD24]|uniref:hypothetical protein n=1 Tax=Rhodococcus sp. ABRD24 TaxID=2507582 RepID=UPI00103AF92D|nr:hypothetical protein [Rhodococcus sp. ABRD24]QBJ97698.1 hypothetical protein ERC79_18435 [Rhodococcus sp. ABRD24]
MNRQTLPLLAAVTMTILTTGCGDQIAAAAALLPTLPSLEDTEKQITDVMVQIADAAWSR